MATTAYTGASGDGDWETSGNWTNGQPDDEYDVIILASATTDLTTNLDRTGDDSGGGLNLNSFHVQTGCPINIGTSSLPLKLTCKDSTNGADSYFWHEGDGVIWWNNESGTSADDTARVICSAGKMVGSTGAAILNIRGDQTIDELSVISGWVSINDSSLTATLGFISPTGAPNTAKLTVLNGAVTTLYNNGGIFDESNNAGAATATTTYYQTGGTSAIANIQGGVTYHISGGYCDFQAKASAVAAGNLVYLLGGTLDCEQPPTNNAPRSIKTIYVSPNAEFLRGDRTYGFAGDTANGWDYSNGLGYVPIGEPYVYDPP